MTLAANATRCACAKCGPTVQLGTITHSDTDRQVPDVDSDRTAVSDPTRDAAPVESPWDGVSDRMRRRGLRWTPQRRTLVDVLRQHRGHVSATELIAQCRERDRTTTPSTVYRTLDVLEEIGLVRHSHGHDGREEFHILPTSEHGHLRCEACGATWEIEADEARQLTLSLARHRHFAVNLSHLTIVGRCGDCTPGRAG